FAQSLGARTSCQGYALAKSVEPRGRVFAPQVLVDPGQPARRASGYGEDQTPTEIPSVAVIDAERARAGTSSLAIPNAWELRSQQREEEEECLLPRAAAVDKEAHALLVACVGSDAVVAYDAASADPARTQRRRWRVAAGPSGIAVDGAHRRAIVWSQFDRS